MWTSTYFDIVIEFYWKVINILKQIREKLTRQRNNAQINQTHNVINI